MHEIHALNFSQSMFFIVILRTGFEICVLRTWILRSGVKFCTELTLTNMALQQASLSECDIVPQKTLNDIDSMYYFLSQRLNTAQQMTDLIPFIQKLIPLNELKQHLKSALDKRYKSTKTMDQINDINNKIESENNIRSLFISLFALNGIPSNNIHAHILSFLPSTEYKKLPLLSTHFRDIFRNSPHLYNSKG